MVWMLLLISLAVLAITYTVLAKPFSDIYNALYPEIQGTPGEDSINKMVVAYKVSPLLIVLGLFLWAFTQMVRRDTQSGVQEEFF